MKKLFSHSALFVALLLAPMTVFAKQMNTKFRHRSGQTAHETRYERNCMATFELELMGGRAKKGYDFNKDKVNALSIYGIDHLGTLGVNAVGDPSGILGALGDLFTLTLGAGIHPNADIGIKFDGKYSLFEANLSYTQNFCNGFFLSANLPIKKLKISNISHKNITSTADFTRLGMLGRGALIRLVGFLAEEIAVSGSNLATTLASSPYDLNIGDASTTGVGDLMLSGGWTCNHDDIEGLDFLDTTIKLGVSLPTAKKRDQNKAFELALGYEKHTGIGAEFDLGLGFYEWITLGAHVGGLFFLDKTLNLRMQTNKHQSGWLKLQKGDAEYDMGNIWHAGGYLKADHIFKGISLMLGYNYAHQGKSMLTPVDTVKFEPDHVNADDMLKGWDQHALTVTLEYDMAEEGRRWNPCFSVFYSRPVKGKYIFATDVGGGTAGVNVAMDF